MSDTKSNKAPKSDITSPTRTNAELIKSCDGMPPTKSVEAIDKVNRPTGHARPAGSVRV